jgi:hypothetical protein
MELLPYAATDIDANHRVRELRYVAMAVREVQIHCSVEVLQIGCAVEALDPRRIQPCGGWELTA